MMGIMMAIKELWNALQFICSVEFWRMSVFWTLSLLVSYCRLLLAPKSESYPRCPPATLINNKPVCIITGVISSSYFSPDLMDLLVTFCVIVV